AEKDHRVIRVDGHGSSALLSPITRYNAATKDRDMYSTAFLDGIRVVTTAQNVPGPLASARLRQAGATVTKIEPPGGDPFLALSPAWHAEMHVGIPIENLDLKTADGQARLSTLLADADVLLTSQRPSALARLALDPDTLRARFSRLRVLRIVGTVRDPE